MAPIQSLNIFERDLQTGDLDDEKLRQYHAASLACGEAEHASRVFAGLARRHPENITLRSLHIALCLQSQDEVQAMQSIEKLMADTGPSDGLLDAALSVRRRLPAEPSPPSGLSLCMIIRNEADRLARFLWMVKPLADEMVVVDTGSRDRSADIARVFGARVFSFEWCHDFSAARNYALSKVLGRWVLVLDADEVIAPEDFDALRKLIAGNDDGKTAFSIRTRNYCNTANVIGWQANDGRYEGLEAGLGWFPSQKARLFPNSAEIRFRHPVHELVEPALRAGGFRILACDIPVHHYGHLNEAANQRKASAYFELGYAKLEQMQEDTGALRELAVQAGQLARWPESIELWRRLLLRKPDFFEAHINLAGAHWQTGDYERALKSGYAAAAIAPDIKEAGFNIAVSLLMLGRTDEAANTLQKITRKNPDYLPALFMQAAAYCILEDHSNARRLIGILNRKLPRAAVQMAQEDLAGRLAIAGRNTDAAKIKSMR